MPSAVRPPRLQVMIRSLYNLKHDGNHYVRVHLAGRSFKSCFCEGPGSYKPIHFSTEITLSDAEALEDGTWEWGSIHIRVFHERLFGSDKMVGECFFPLSKVKAGRVSDRVPLLYKGHERGSIEMSIEAHNLPTKAASATSPLDPEYRERLLRIRESSSRSVSPKSTISHREHKHHNLPSVSDKWP